MDLEKRSKLISTYPCSILNSYIKIFMKIGGNDKKIIANLNKGYHSYKLLLLFVKVLSLPLGW